MIIFEKGKQEAVCWVWKEVSSIHELVTFNISGDSCMKIFNSDGEEVDILKLGYNQNRLTFDGGEDLKVYLIAIIKDYSNLPSGMYTYTINVESLIDELKVEDSGQLEIING